MLQDLLLLSAWQYATVHLHGLSEEWTSVLIMIYTGRINTLLWVGNVE
jgi:hypothetical protein